MQLCPRRARFWCNRSWEPSKKRRGQGQSLPNKSLVCSGKLEGRDLHQHKSHRTPKCMDIRQPGKVLGAGEASQILGEGQPPLKRGNDQLKTRQRAAVGGCLATSLPARRMEQLVPFVPPPLCHLLSRQGLGPPCPMPWRAQP